MYPISPVNKKKIVRVLKDIGIALSFIWAGYNTYTANKNYVRSNNEKTEILKKNDSLQVLVAGQRKAIETFIINESSRSYSLDKLPNPTWYKILDEETFIILFVNKAYQQLMPEGMSRFELFGKTGHLLDFNFGEIYQANDLKASQSLEASMFVEPYYENGKVVQGRFLKWRDWENTDDVVVFGMFIEKVKSKK